MVSVCMWIRSYLYPFVCNSRKIPVMLNKLLQVSVKIFKSRKKLLERFFPVKSKLFLFVWYIKPTWQAYVCIHLCPAKIQILHKCIHKLCKCALQVLYKEILPSISIIRNTIIFAYCGTILFMRLISSFIFYVIANVDNT